MVVGMTWKYNFRQAKILRDEVGHVGASGILLRDGKLHHSLEHNFSLLILVVHRHARWDLLYASLFLTKWTGLNIDSHRSLLALAVFLRVAVHFVSSSRLAY